MTCPQVDPNVHAVLEGLSAVAFFVFAYFAFFRGDK